MPLLSLNETRRAQRAAANSLLAAAQACPCVGVAVPPEFPDPCQKFLLTVPSVGRGWAQPQPCRCSGTRHLSKPLILAFIGLCSQHPILFADVATAVGVWVPTAKKKPLSPVYAPIRTKITSRQESPSPSAKCPSVHPILPMPGTLPPPWGQ